MKGYFGADLMIDVDDSRKSIGKHEFAQARTSDAFAAGIAGCRTCALSSFGIHARRTGHVPGLLLGNEGDQALRTGIDAHAATRAANGIYFGAAI